MYYITDFFFPLDLVPMNPEVVTGLLSQPDGSKIQKGEVISAVSRQ